MSAGMLKVCLMPGALHPIHLTARLTGLSAHVIRVWELRHHAIAPERSPANYRLYSETDIRRLNLLRQATQAGHSIGQIARLTDGELEELLAASASPALPLPSPETASASEGDYLESALAAIRALESRALDDTLKRASSALGGQGVLHHLVSPLVETVGDWWREGRITAAHEHFAMGHLRAFLANLARPYDSAATAPALVVATPSGQLHEMGAWLVSCVAANLGWNVTCLGASLPAWEIAGAARQKQARAVALSLVYPEDDPVLPGELALLRDALPAEIALLAGGRAMPAYRAAITRLGIVPVDGLTELGSILDGLRRSHGACELTRSR